MGFCTGMVQAADFTPAERTGAAIQKSTKVFIACIDGEDVSITGKGAIDGQGVKFYDTTMDLWGRFCQKPPPAKNASDGWERGL